ncbi:hypothetical protein [Chitinophaga arvensicola]|uniref:Uncharacterized protein n=1 Tax=Chitinophaga arvensicola TaxID=29529 RepID=A0A1I0RGA2_9BACT|nr:hypothetical protein [Chitinophaga arvensicola]SEW39887.1 hypothetical protein SAMN04488122_2795 [Chitinophaga arvensicola]
MQVITITDILNKTGSEITMDDLIYCFEKVRGQGDVGFIKLDGERKENQYTVCIMFPGIKEEMIRADESTLKEALLKVLSKYVDVKKGI